jgi:uncharacterized repeat protein (TIGR03803 family)
VDCYNGLIEGRDGALYGTTSGGGSTGWGIVFAINRNASNYRILHFFSGMTGDGGPIAALIQASDGALYGTTSGGRRASGYGGTLFTVDTNGGGYAVLHSFTNSSDGADPESALLEASDGALYGATVTGGSYGYGTLFSLNKNGSGYHLLHHFNYPGDGVTPYCALVEGPDGALYGTTDGGGTDGAGTVFKLNKDGSNYSILHNFSTNGIDGLGPVAGLFLAANGIFYGTTFAGGQAGMGTVFRIWPPETPDMLGAATVGNSVLVGFSGVSGYNYQILRSTDLSNWISLGTILMPPSGVFTNIDSTPPKPAALYRAAWVP